jgi:peptidoglycan hydrolase-like protein with peptidoglycan-binding domain
MKKDLLLAKKQGVEPRPPFKKEAIGLEEKEREAVKRTKIETRNRERLNLKPRQPLLPAAEPEKSGRIQEFEEILAEKAKKKEEERQEQEEKIRTEKEKILDEAARRITEERRAEREKQERERKQEQEKRRAEEEERRREEEKKKREEEERRKNPKYKALKEKKELKKEKNKLKKDLFKLSLAKRPLQAQKRLLLEKIEKVEDEFGKIAVQEQKIEEKEKIVEEKEKRAKTIKEERKAEKERRELEEKRQEMERQRWPFGRKLEDLESSLNEIEIKLREIENKEEELHKEEEKIFKREKEIELELDKLELQQEIQKLAKAEALLKERKESILSDLEKNKNNLNNVLKEEQKIDEEIELIEKREKEAEELKERRRAERVRWGLEEKKRQIKNKKWDIATEIQKIEEQTSQIEKKLDNLFEKKNELNSQIKIINQKLGIVPPEEKPIPETQKKEEGENLIVPKFIEETEKKRNEELVKEEKQFKTIVEEDNKAREQEEERNKKQEEEKEKEEGENKERKIEEAKERIKILKQKEFEENQATKEAKEARESAVITEKAEEMFQEKEKESQKIAEEKRREELLRRLRMNKERIEKSFSAPASRPPAEPKEIIKIVPQKLSSRVKLWLRIAIFAVVLIILTGIATFWYWFLVARKQPPAIISCASDVDCLSGQVCSKGACIKAPTEAKCASDADCLLGQICGPEGSCIKKPSKFVVPPALFPISKTRTLNVSGPEELRLLLPQILGESQNKGLFTRLVIRNSKNNAVLGLKEFFEYLLVRLPDDFYQKVDNNFTLFIYSQIQGNRLGFVAKVKNYNGLENLLRNEEPKMENDFQTLLSFMGAKGAAIVPYFRNASNIQRYTGPNFRYQTINNQDLGVLYLTSGNYLVFTSSWKSMEEVIKRLKITGARLELTTDLKLGDRGYEVKLLQTWLAQDATVYPRGLVSGYFGNLTKQAVMRFQEKYASDILAPQGLIKGTGIVDSYTRIKLNELYGDSGIKPTKTEITTDLRMGSYGEEVKLLQMWLAKDSDIYPEGIVSGYFGYLTRRALIKFQEKYASDILAPQGLSKGTGIVDALTRKKLNEIYGKR